MHKQLKTIKHNTGHKSGRSEVRWVGGQALMVKVYQNMCFFTFLWLVNNGEIYIIGGIHLVHINIMNMETSHSLLHCKSGIQLLGETEYIKENIVICRSQVI